MKKLVACNICGKELKYINWKHLMQHGTNLYEYRRMFPKSKIVCDSFKEELVMHLKGLSPWIKGLNKNIDPRVAKISNSLKRGFKEGRVVWNKNIEYVQIKGDKNPAKKLEARKKISAKKFKYWEDWRKNIENLSKHSNFRLLAFDIYKMAQVCFFCNKSEDLHIHHIDVDNKNNIKRNLLVLCRSCHRKIHNLRILETNILKEKNEKNEWGDKK